MLIDSPVCDFNWKAPDFTLPDLDGTMVSIEKSYGTNGLLIAFICNHCPYVQAIIARLAADARALYADGVNTVAIMPNDFAAYPQDNPAAMKIFAQQHRLPFPYLLDESQAVARAYRAVCTPDFFGFNRHGGLHYRGRLDDIKMNGGHDDCTARGAELLTAMRRIAGADAGPEVQTPSMGCSIKWRE